jgi:hypothetical protein
MVVLNGGLTACPLPGEPSLGQDTAHTCGFCQEPGDVSQAVVQGSRAAALIAARLAGCATGGKQ